MKKITLFIGAWMLIASAQARPTYADSTAQAQPAVENDSTPVITSYPYIAAGSDNADIDTLLMQLKFGEADAMAKKLMATAKRRRKPIDSFEKDIAYCRLGESGLRGVDKLIIVDSIVIDKKDFLKAYPMHEDLGFLSMTDKGDAVSYQTQLNGMLLTPQLMKVEEGEQLQMTRSYLENGKVIEAETVKGLGVDGDINYPFLMPDGQTFYFAARSNDGYGNYDLYVTRYDSESKQFYQAENMGYPYNSYANDYMMVIDENAGVGWFASDRYQPQDKVCVYTFIPNQSRQTIDYESTDLGVVRASASLQSIAAIPLTEEQQQSKANARKRIKNLASTTATAKHMDFEFVLNDAKTCYTLSDFKSAEAKKLCSDWIQKTKNLAALNEQLQQMRDVSPTARQQILNLETRVVELQAEVRSLEKSIRSTELSQQQ